MTNATGVTAPAAYARFAGLSYLAIFALAIYANFVVFDPLIVSGDPAATAANITKNASEFRLGIAASLTVLIFDVLVAWSLYLVMKPVSASLSLLSAIFQLVYATAYISVVLKLVSALRFLDAPQNYAAFDAAQIETLGYHFIAGHGAEFAMTLIFFGMRLLLLGYLIIRSTFLPSLIGALVALAGAGYIIDAYASFLIPAYSAAKLSTYVAILPGLIGEGLLTLWLIVFGVNRDKWLEASG